MTSEHEKLECYTCHNGWNVDFFGFHFDRNEQFTQLDLLSGERTPGRVTTQEKVFATFNQLRLGWNHEGEIAPWLVGFSTIGSAHDAQGPDAAAPGRAGDAGRPLGRVDDPAPDAHDAQGGATVPSATAPRRPGVSARRTSASCASSPTRRRSAGS
jgi:hypothetical protein